MKTEPDTFSFQQLLDQKKTNWNLVRNYQARNFLRQIKKNDLVLIYHSNIGKEIVGIAKVIREAYPDLDPDGGDWVQVDVAPVRALKNPVSLQVLKSTPTLASLLLIKQSRLSVMPVSAAHYNKILKMAE